MKPRQTYKDFVATPWGFNVFRAVDALHRMTKTMLYHEEQNACFSHYDGRWHVVRDYGWRVVRQRVDERSKVNCRLSRAFLRRLDEQIKRAELAESARLQ